MYIKNPVRRAVAAAALATSAAIAVGAVGARADSSITPGSGSIDAATGHHAGDAPPGSALAGDAGMGVTLARQYEVVDGDSFWGIAERQLPDDATASTAWASLTTQFPELSPYERLISCAVNEEYAKLSTPLREGDEVAFLPPVSGGCAGAHPIDGFTTD